MELAASKRVTPAQFALAFTSILASHPRQPAYNISHILTTTPSFSWYSASILTRRDKQLSPVITTTVLNRNNPTIARPNHIDAQPNHPKTPPPSGCALHSLAAPTHLSFPYSSHTRCPGLRAAFKWTNPRGHLPTPSPGTALALPTPVPPARTPSTTTTAPPPVSGAALLPTVLHRAALSTHHLPLPPAPHSTPLKVIQSLSTRTSR